MSLREVLGRNVEALSSAVIDSSPGSWYRHKHLWLWNLSEMSWQSLDRLVKFRRRFPSICHLGAQLLESNRMHSFSSLDFASSICNTLLLILPTHSAPFGVDLPFWLVHSIFPPQSS